VSVGVVQGRCTSTDEGHWEGPIDTVLVLGPDETSALAALLHEINPDTYVNEVKLAPNQRESLMLIRRKAFGH
jgi:hypothetical protein